MRNTVVAPMLLAWAAMFSVASAAPPKNPETVPPAPQAAFPEAFAPGTGPGVHGANSPFAPLVERSDVLPWSTLTDVKTKAVKNRLLPAFPPTVQALSDKVQRVQGFMMPLEPGEKQQHFLLTSVPMTCAFCTPGGPESMVEVKTRVAVRYVLEPVVMEGQFSVLPDDPYGLYYRLSEARSVK